MSEVTSFDKITKVCDNKKFFFVVRIENRGKGKNMQDRFQRQGIKGS